MSEEEGNEKKKDFVVEIDTKETERLATEKEKLRAENEDLKEKLSIIAEKQLLKRMNELHLTSEQRSEVIKDPTLLRNYIKTPAGSVGLTPQQYGEQNDLDLYRRKFPDEQSMVTAILNDMHSSDSKKAEIAKSYYEGLLGLWVRGKRSKQGLDEFYDSNKVENLPNLKKEGGFTVPAEKEGGDIGKLQKMWRLERKRKAEEGAV